MYFSVILTDHKPNVNVNVNFANEIQWSEQSRVSVLNINIISC